MPNRKAPLQTTKEAVAFVDRWLKEFNETMRDLTNAAEKNNLFIMGISIGLAAVKIEELRDVFEEAVIIERPSDPFEDA